MASVYELKPRFQALLRPLVACMAKAGITANQITVGAMLLSVSAGVMVAINPGEAWPLLLMPVVLFVRMALNAIDGMLAREFNQQSALGGFLNELGDVVSDIALYLSFALVAGIQPWLVIGIVLLAVISEMAGVIAVQVGASRRYDGPMGKSDRAFVFGALALALGVGVPVGMWLTLLLGAVFLLLLATIANRMQRALAEIQ